MYEWKRNIGVLGKYLVGLFVLNERRVVDNGCFFVFYCYILKVIGLKFNKVV